MAHLLATALGRLAAKRELVCKIALPARLPRAFLHEVAAAARGPGSVAYVVTESFLKSGCKVQVAISAFTA